MSLDCVNTGQTEKGFFVAEITPTRLRVGYHTHKDPKADVPEWEWKFLLEKPVAVRRPPRPE